MMYQETIKRSAIIWRHHHLQMENRFNLSAWWDANGLKVTQPIPSWPKIDVRTPYLLVEIADVILYGDIRVHVVPITVGAAPWRVEAGSAVHRAAGRDIWWAECEWGCWVQYRCRGGRPAIRTREVAGCWRITSPRPTKQSKQYGFLSVGYIQCWLSIALDAV